MHKPSIPPDLPDAQAGAFALHVIAENRLLTTGYAGHRFALFFSSRKRAERYLRLEASPQACEWIEVIPVSEGFVQVTKRMEMLTFILGRMDSFSGREAARG